MPFCPHFFSELQNNRKKIKNTKQITRIKTPYKTKTFIHCWFDVEQPSATPAQHLTSIVPEPQLAGIIIQADVNSISQNFSESPRVSAGTCEAVAQFLTRMHNESLRIRLKTLLQNEWYIAQLAHVPGSRSLRSPCGRHTHVDCWFGIGLN